MIRNGKFGRLSRSKIFTFITCISISLTGCDGDGGIDPDAISNIVGAVFNRVVGASSSGFADGPHNVARFNNPVNVEVAADGRVFVADYDNDAIRVISTAGVVSTLVTLPAGARPFGLTITPDGTLYVQSDGDDMGNRDDTTGTVWRVDTGTGMATVIARDLGRPRGIQALDDNTLAMSDIAHHVITLLNLTTGAETIIAGAEDMTGTANNSVPGLGSLARFNRPYGLALMADGSLLVADQSNHRLRQVMLNGVVSTFAGSAMGSQDGAVGTATFNAPQDVAVDLVGGHIYVADHDNYLIRRISGGTVFTQAGTVGMRGFVDAEGTAAQFSGMEGIAINADGSTLWIADGDNGEEPGDPGFDPVANENFHHVRRLFVP